MAADIPAGLGYLAAGLAAAGVTVPLVINRRRFGNWMADRYVSVAMRATAKRPYIKLLYHTWLDPRWQDEQFRAKSVVRIWLPYVISLPLFSVVMLTAATAEFSR